MQKTKTETLSARRLVYGFAKYMRDACRMLPISVLQVRLLRSTDVNTPAVFGNYVDVYDILQAVTDRATVKIYYESRLAKNNLERRRQETGIRTR